MAKKVTHRRNGSRNARGTLEGAARLTPVQVSGTTRMVSRSMLGARAGIRAKLLSVTYDHPVIIRNGREQRVRTIAYSNIRSSCLLFFDAFSS